MRDQSSGPLDDTRTLLLGALEGDEEARGELLEHLRPRLLLWSTTRMSAELRAKYDAEDVAQEILMAVHRGLASFEEKGERAFRSWLFHVAENRIRDLAAYTGAKKRRAVPITPFTQTSPSNAAIRMESLSTMHRALATLPEDYRRVLQHRRLEERDVREVARLMDRSENAVRILYCRALRALKQALSESA